MLNKILGSFNPTKTISQKSAKSLVNIASEAGNMNNSKEIEILKQAKDIIENFAKQNNIQVDMFFKEAKTHNIKKEMVDISVKNCKNDSLVNRTIVYKRSDKPVNFITEKDNIRLVKVANKDCYDIPEKLGKGIYEDSFLRYVYRTIEHLKNIVTHK